MLQRLYFESELGETSDRLKAEMQSHRMKSLQETSVMAAGLSS
jgi:hypothetical protein